MIENFQGENMTDIAAICQNIPGFEECDEQDVNEWLEFDHNLQGHQIYEDDEIVDIVSYVTYMYIVLYELCMLNMFDNPNNLIIRTTPVPSSSDYRRSTVFILNTVVVATVNSLEISRIVFPLWY
uniref:Uncharacterized protein LOC114329729 n=1 Tax=Diabrotica virgifera virgifera TaxID=50390 RepID=A0A6P7FP04_DIAVI